MALTKGHHGRSALHQESEGDMFDWGLESVVTGVATGLGSNDKLVF